MTHTFESGYTIRSPRIEELTLLAPIEQSAAIRFQGTPYAFLVDASPLPLEFIQQRFQTGQIWVAVDPHQTKPTNPFHDEYLPDVGPNGYTCK
jgi:hypothetical protein